MNKTLALVLLIFACLARGFAASDVVYVAYNGADIHPCTRVSPCKTITHALTVVNAGGQVVIIGSGTYDNFTINKGATVAAEPGVIAVLDVAANATGITVSAGANDRVVIRGLYLNGQGPGSVTSGIWVKSAAEVSLENIVARNFDSFALNVVPTAGFFISVKGGVYAMAPLGASSTVTPWAILLFCCNSLQAVPPVATIDGVTVEDGCTGILVEQGIVTITNSLVSGGTISNSNCDQQFGGPGTVGVFMAFSTAVIENNVISGFDHGVSVLDNGTYAYLSSNVITGNSTGVYSDSGGTVLTRGNNTIAANGQNVSGTMTPFSGQ